MSFVSEENKNFKICKSDEYNYIFNKNNGFFARWGKTKKDDPQFSPFGPEILDIEITTICNGIPNKENKISPCKFCYKSNTKNGKNMSFEILKKVLDKFDKKILTQIAFGVDASATSNPDLWSMMKYCRSQGIIPNITVADISDETADKLVSVCGAVAVSRYENKDICYNSIKKMTDAVLRKKIYIKKIKKG